MIGVVIVPERSSSLAPLNENRPDCLLPILDRNSLDLNLSALSEFCAEIYVVVDCETETVKAAVETRENVHVISASECAGAVQNAPALAFVMANVYMPVPVLKSLANPDAGLFRSQTGCLIAGRLEGPAVSTFDVASTQDLSSASETIEDVIELRYPWNLLEANVAALKSLEPSQVDAVIEDGVTLSGDVYVGPGTRIKSGTYIEGPVYIGSDCVIGPGAYIRPDTVIADRVTLGHAVEIYDSVVFEDTTGKHRSYIGHSVIGSGVNLGCGFITSDYRHDGATHRTLIDGEVVDSGRRKLGAFLGDSVMTGIQTLVYPGRKIWGGCTTLPGEVVKKDVGRLS